MTCSSLRRALVAGLSFFALVIASGGAHADFRQYLSTTGNDANLCTRLAPCRLLPRALAVVDPGGEIWMMDSGTYNTVSPVVISKSVTILAVPGQLGSVVGNNGTAFSIAGAGIEVTLQNLNILSFLGTGDVGVLVTNATQVSVINCNIFGFKGLTAGSNNGVGVWVDAGENFTKVNVVDSTIRNNTLGIVVAGNGRANVSRTHVLGNDGVGIISRSQTGTSIVHVSDSVSSGNSHGFAASGCDGTCTSQMFVTRSVAAENVVDGFLTEGGTNTFMTVEDSMVTHNLVGFNHVKGTFYSRGNNTVFGNPTSALGTITPQSAL